MSSDGRDVVENLVLTYINPDIREDDKNPEGLITALGEKFGAGFREVVDKNLNDMDDLLEALEEKVGEELQRREQESVRSDAVSRAFHPASR